MVFGMPTAQLTKPKTDMVTLQYVADVVDCSVETLRRACVETGHILGGAIVAYPISSPGGKRTHWRVSRHALALVTQASV